VVILSFILYVKDDYKHDCTFKIYD